MADVHDVFINSNSTTEVVLDEAAIAKSVTVGQTDGLATLRLAGGAALETETLNIERSGTLTGDGLVVGDIENRGRVLSNDNLTVSGSLYNHGLIEGDGRISATVRNEADGHIRARNGDSLWLANDSTPTNAGLIEINDAEIRIDASNLSNLASTGLITLADGSLVANDITNQGSIATFRGDNQIIGDINNLGGIIQVSGGAHTTFFGDLEQNGALQVSSVGNTNSVAVILGEFSGAGGFVGGGDLFALGDLRPGNSPASVLYDGNLFLGVTTDTEIELGGIGLGEFDQMLVTGDLALAGDLAISLIDGHQLSLGDEYLIADIGGTLSGQFLGLGEGDLVTNFGGMDLFISYAAGDGNDISLFVLQAVPEPGSAVLLLASAICLIVRRKRRATGLKR